MTKRSVGCWKCGSQNCNYQVKDNIWEKTGLPKHIKFIFVELCLDCLEQIVGKLSPNNFTDAGINSISGE